jgi:hypothetical protein
LRQQGGHSHVAIGDHNSRNIGTRGSCEAMRSTRVIFAVAVGFPPWEFKGSALKRT